METLSQTAGFLATVLVTTWVIDRASPRLLVWFVSQRALSRHRGMAGGSNRLMLHGLNHASNCRTPLSVADAVVSYCVFDVSRAPLRLRANIPSGHYWSLTCYGLDTTNFFSLNDQQLEESHAESSLSDYRTLTVVLSPRHQPIEPAEDERVIETTGPRGIILIRVLMNNPEDENELATIMKTQRENQVESLQQ
jgi:uncharacterized membrane protein